MVPYHNLLVLRVQKNYGGGEKGVMVNISFAVVQEEREGKWIES